MTVLLKNWRFYTNAVNESSLSPLAAEQVVPTLSSTDIQNGIIRLRLSLYNNVSGTITGALKLQYSGDNTNWQDISDNSTRAEDEFPIKWATDNPNVVNNTTPTQLLLSNTNVAGKILLVESTSVSVTPSITEFDISLYINWPAPNFTYLLRVVHNGATIANDTGIATLSFTTPDSQYRPHTITKVDSGSSYPEPRDIRYALWDRVWYDTINTRWWTFFVNPADKTRVENWYRDPSDTIWKIGTNGNPNIGGNSIDQGRMTTNYKVINGITTVALLGILSGSNAKFRHGYLTDTSIVCSTTVDTGETRQRYGHTCFDSANYVWIGSIDTTLGGIWAKRTSTACPGGAASWVPSFNTRKTLVDSGVSDGNLFAMMDIDNQNVLCVWYNGTAIKSAIVNNTSGFGSITTVASTANSVDWGWARLGNYVYLCHSSSTGKSGTLTLRIYDIVNNTWLTGPTGRTLSNQTTGDGLAVIAGSDGIFAFSTYSNDPNDPTGTTSGTTLREVRYQKYTPDASIIAGIWGSTQTIPNTGGRVNMDFIGSSRTGANGELAFIVESGDDELVGTPHILEYFMIPMSTNMLKGITTIASNTIVAKKSTAKLFKTIVNHVLKVIKQVRLSKILQEPITIKKVTSTSYYKKIVSLANKRIVRSVGSHTYTISSITQTLKKSMATAFNVHAITTALSSKINNKNIAIVQPINATYNKVISYTKRVVSNALFSIGTSVSNGIQYIHITVHSIVNFTGNTNSTKSINSVITSYTNAYKQGVKDIQRDVNISVRNIRDNKKLLHVPIPVVTTLHVLTSGISQALITITRQAKYQLERIFTIEWKE